MEDAKLVHQVIPGWMVMPIELLEACHLIRVVSVVEPAMKHLQSAVSAVAAVKEAVAAAVLAVIPVVVVDIVITTAAAAAVHTTQEPIRLILPGQELVMDWLLLPGFVME